MPKPVRTRFAPSPTGYLHIGGVRTALFCWLFAKKHNGQFILRIDDTDQKRNDQSTLQPILDGFRWLGIDWDEGPEIDGPHAPYYQSQRSDHYQIAVEELLKSGHAYKDYATAEELAAEREAAEASKGSRRYSRTWMAEDEKQAAAYEAEGRTFTVRMKIPLSGSCVINDLVRGRVEFDWAEQNDTIIQRADGSCTYHLASVVDDHAFEITHVIRAEEHLSNTPRQIFIAESLGYDLPEYAHLPYVAAPGGKEKLSKRKIPQYLKNPDFAKVYNHGLEITQAIGLETSEDSFNPVLVDFYKTAGYLPDAVLNYLLLLGWSLDDKTEIFSREEMMQHFDLDRVVKGSASFDIGKLTNRFQKEYIQQLSLDEKYEYMIPYLQQAGMVASGKVDEATETKVKQIIEAAGDRITLFGDVIAQAEFAFQSIDEVDWIEKEVNKRILKDDTPLLLKKYRDQLAELEPFNLENIEASMKTFAETENIKFGEIANAVRVSMTGGRNSFSVIQCVLVLGKEMALERIDRALSFAK